jgi:hypothetical protein
VERLIAKWAAAAPPNVSVTLLNGTPLPPVTWMSTRDPEKPATFPLEAIAAAPLIRKPFARGVTSQSWIVTW